MQVCTGLQKFKTPPPARHTHKVKHLSKLMYIVLKSTNALGNALLHCLVTFYFLTSSWNHEVSQKSTKIWLKNWTQHFVLNHKSKRTLLKAWYFINTDFFQNRVNQGPICTNFIWVCIARSTFVFRNQTLLNSSTRWFCFIISQKREEIWPSFISTPPISLIWLVQLFKIHLDYTIKL